MSHSSKNLNGHPAEIIPNWLNLDKLKTIPSQNILIPPIRKAAIEEIWIHMSQAIAWSCQY